MFGRLVNWFNRLSQDAYELQGSEIVMVRGVGRGERISVHEIVSWDTMLEMGFDVVTIELKNGESVPWLDYRDDLLEILRKVVDDRGTSWP